MTRTRSADLRVLGVVAVVVGVTSCTSAPALHCIEDAPCFIPGCPSAQITCAGDAGSCGCPTPPDLGLTPDAGGSSDMSTDMPLECTTDPSGYRGCHCLDAGTAITPACRPDGTCYTYADTCVEPGFVACRNAADAGAVAVACDAYCASDGGALAGCP